MSRTPLSSGRLPVTWRWPNREAKSRKVLNRLSEKVNDPASCPTVGMAHHCGPGSWIPRNCSPMVRWGARSPVQSPGRGRGMLQIVTSVFDSVQNEHNYSKFLNTYHHQFITYLTECTVLLLTMVQVLYLLEVFILAHYGPPSTETPTTETTTVRCHKNSGIYLTSTYYWRLLRRTITIRFDSKLRIIAQLFDSTLFSHH